ncbi:Retrovirus-related Pol poly from transposon [Paramuricea clavata]|uniref:Retrovirus-related Pol poly from transposon n=1 Tax=Paramuricea clavata TaxID=317549 RepID=A0A6S7G6K5_PARCT|nr:Retrovirus-related Pol poly from transposon [Paramuricea clavata]
MATKLTHLAPPPAFDAESDKSSLAQRWKDWRERFDMYIADAKQKRALLLYVSGPAVHKIFNTLTDTGTDYKTAVEKLDSYFQPQKNVIYERYVFKQTRPSPDELVDHFITRLRQLADTCEFASVEDEIRDHFVITIIGRQSVMADEEDTKLNRLTTNRSRSGDQNESFQQGSKTANISGKYTATIFQVTNKFAQHKENHVVRVESSTILPKVCRSSPMRKPEFRAQNREKWNEIDNSIKAIITTPRETGTGSSANDDSDEYTFTFTLTQDQSKFSPSPTKVTKTNKGVFVTVKINETDIRLVLDSGATTNILDSESFERIQKNNAKLQLEPTSIKIYPYNSTVPLPTTGKFEVQFCNGTKTTSATFHVVEGNSGSLLGYETATELGLLHVNVNQTTTMPISTSSNTSDLVAKFQHYLLALQVSARIEESEALDIIERASGSTSWVSPMVAAPKPHNPSEVRIFALATIKLNWKKNRDLLPPFAHMKAYIDISDYPSASPLRLKQSHQGLHGVRNIADDLIVWGKSQEEHDRNLEALFQRLDAKGLTLNGDKCEYNQPSLWFYGYSLSKDGLSADPKKVEPIVKTTTPQNVAQLRSFLGLANYCARFIKDFATLSAPLNELTKKSTKWQWTVIHQQAFEKIKTAIAEDCSMAFYDPAKETTLTVDASLSVLGPYCLRYKRMVPYATFHMQVAPLPPLNAATRRQKKKPLQCPKSKPPPRIGRWLLRMQQYLYQVQYRPGSSKPADVLSRQPTEICEWSANTADKYINFIESHAVPKSMALEEIASETSTDSELQAVIKAVQTGHWYSELQAVIKAVQTGHWYEKNDPNCRYVTAYHELSITNNGILLRYTRIIIPKFLQSRTLAIAHEGHQGETVLVVIDGYSRYVEVEIMKSTTTTAVVSRLKKIFARHGYPDELTSDNGPPFNAADFDAFLNQINHFVAHHGQQL